MANSRPPYPADVRQQMVELAQAGRRPAELAREFGCTAQSIVSVQRSHLEPEGGREAVAFEGKGGCHGG